MQKRKFTGKFSVVKFDRIIFLSVIILLRNNRCYFIKDIFLGKNNISIIGNYKGKS